MNAQLKDLAWLGDAVLALFAREWLLTNPPISSLTRQELFIRFTNNDFLNALGEPTKVEAEIGVHYREGGLAQAFQFIETTIKPLFLTQLRKYERANKGRK